MKPSKRQQVSPGSVCRMWVMSFGAMQPLKNLCVSRSLPNGWENRRQSRVCRRSDSAPPCILFLPVPYLSPFPADRRIRRGKKAALLPTAGSLVVIMSARQKRRRRGARAVPALLSFPEGRAHGRMRRVPPPVR